MEHEGEDAGAEAADESASSSFDQDLNKYIAHVCNSYTDVDTLGLGHSGVGATSELESALANMDPSGLLATIESIHQKNLGSLKAIEGIAKQFEESNAMLSTVSKALAGRQEPLTVNGAVMGDSSPSLNGAHAPEDDPEAALRGQLEEQPTNSQCVVQHPGALCCTKTMLARDFQNDTCMVTIQTIARRVEGGGSPGSKNALEMPHLVALASQALLSSASDFQRANNKGLAENVYTTRRTNAHKHICKILRKGDIVKATHNGTSQFGHESYIVDIKEPESGRTIKALFKPKIPGNADGWHRVPIEYVAYKLGMMLGMDYVPPVAYRNGGLDVDFRHFQEGAFIYFCPNASELKNHSEAEWGIRKDVFLSDTRILDVLLNNSDRHHGHFLIGEHWVEGQWEGPKWVGNMRPMLIDHAAGFRKEAVVTLDHENAFGTGPVRCVSARTYLRLRFLDASAIANAFSQFLDEREMRDLLLRRSTILRKLDELVETQGYSNTVIE